jgi:ketosteroid isomerase-like protein
MTLRSRLVFGTFATALLSLSSPSMGAEDADVKTAIEANHAAIHSLNIAEIANVWSHSADVTLINPNDTSVSVGWDAVSDRWEDMIEHVDSLDIKQTEGPYVTVTGDVARAIGIAHATLHIKSQAPIEVTFAETDVLLKQNGKWLIVSHSAKPM